MPSVTWRHSYGALALSLSFCVSSAWGDCSSPAGTAGNVFFNSTTKTIQYCNGTNWFNVGQSVPAAGTGGCSSPAAEAGDVVFNSTLGMVQYCNGESWVDTTCSEVVTPGGVGCSGEPGGTIRYVGSSVNELQFCDSTNWVTMGWPCKAPAGWVQLKKAIASDGTTASYFGVSSGISGNSAVVGAYGADGKGAAYVYTGSNNAWSEQQKLTPSDLATGDNFGQSVAIDGDTVFGGSFGDDDNGSSSGSAYVFTRSGSTWTQQAKLKPSDGAGSDYFGRVLALDNGNAIISAYGDDDNGSLSGSAYIFSGSGSSWTQDAKLTASDGAANDEFGYSVDIQGNTAVVGAPFKNTGTGAAYVFVVSGSTWVEQQKLTASDATGNDYFGRGVAVYGDTILIGAYGDGDYGPGSGSVYVFTRSGSTWTQQTKLNASDAANGDNFGLSLDLKGNRAIIGAYKADNTDDSINQVGAAYIFTGSGASWTEEAILMANDGELSDFLGYSVAIDGTQVIAGAYYEDHDGLGQAGAAYIFGYNP